MKRCMRAAAWLMLIVLAAVFPLWTASVGVKVDRRQLIWRSRNTWTGVLRLWKCEGWQSGNGTLTAWLNTCIEKFEKQHKGVYIQMNDISEQTMRNFAVGSVNPPDMILYAPGMLEAPYDLIVLAEEAALKDSLRSVGMWQGERYAVPVAMGGYALAVNQSPIGGEKAFELDAPTDGDYNSWSAVLMALFSGSRMHAPDEREPLVGDGIDLGLPGQEQPVQPTSAGEADVLPAFVPKDFRTQKSVYARFTSGTIAAMPVTQREIRRLELLEESGKAPDWKAVVTGVPFTDQLVLFSITARQAEDMTARQQLCIEFMKLMLSEPMQQKLTQVRAFSVCDIAPMYSGRRGMSALEQALSSEYLLVPDVFSTEWRNYAKQLMDEIKPGESSYEQFERLKEALELSPNSSSNPLPP